MIDNPARIRLVADYIESMLSVNFRFESELAYIMATLHGDSGMGDRIQGGERLAEQEKYLMQITRIPEFEEKWQLRERVLTGLQEAQEHSQPLIELLNLRCRKNCVSKEELAKRLDCSIGTVYRLRDDYLEIMYRNLFLPWQRVE